MSEQTLDQVNREFVKLLPLKQKWYLLIAGIGIYSVMALVSIINTINLQGLLSRFSNGDTGAAYELAAMNKEGTTPLSVLLAGIGITCIVFVCMWLYRASLNLHESGVNYLNYQPGWLVGWFFIPVAHIFMPVLAMKEMVKGNLSLANENDHSSWQNNAVPKSFYLWSFAYVAKMVVAYGMMFYGVSLAREMANQNVDAQIDFLQITVYISYIGTAFLVVEAAALYFLSKQITEIQESYSNQN
jgi:hypothetical protein